MLSLNGIRVVRGEEGVAFAGADQDRPDLTDSATLGCLLALVRDALSDPALCVVSYHAPNGLAHKVVWSVDATNQQWQQQHRLFDLPSEAEALVAALEAAGGGE
jgi:hypothetical protein